MTSNSLGWLGASAIALASLAAASGCASTRASGPAVDEALAERPDALIQLRSEGCDSGRCPVYGVTVYVDGSVVYRGGANVAPVGERRSKLPAADVGALLSTLEKMDFMDTPEHCCDCPDASETPGSVKLLVDYRPGGVQKEVLVDACCATVPEAMWTLIRQIEAAAAVAGLPPPRTPPC